MVFFLKEKRMICTFLLSAYFCLDVFFVFITPFFTKDGKSIMGEIATAGIDNVFYKQSFMEEFAAGRKNVDLMPTLIQIMDIGFDPLGACTRNLIILGLGDIVFPGFLLSYCHAFDLMTNKKGLYYIISVITYGLGVLIVNIVARYIESEQPALFYIVPTILIPPILFAWYRKELSLLWHGFQKIEKIKKQEIDTIELTADSANIQPNEILEEVNSHEQNI
ncbi:signal peptide peptidase-like 2B [Trichonephila clavata]|uniref:Signal peptide peptidase-like 2B n=1 Tax=Trichonephila clavata TaxID=2740835 RepID=A0A8X6LLQ2_TRICU|nr:signal peptide peptidase-like 2B [Trichonephila clavata]